MATTVAAIAATIWAQSPTAQIAGPTQNHVTIPFLANASKPSDLEFEGAECEIGAGGSRMTCAFQQLFLTTSPVAPDTCLVTTNRYEREFRRDSPVRWINREGRAWRRDDLHPDLEFPDLAALADWLDASHATLSQDAA